MASSYNNIQQTTSKLLQLENQISSLNTMISRLREQKSLVEQQLVQQMSQQGLTNHQITLGENKIRVCCECNYTPLSYKFLEEQLNSLFPGNPENIKNMIKYIKNQRGKKYSTGVKIVSKKQK